MTVKDKRSKQPLFHFHQTWEPVYDPFIHKDGQLIPKGLKKSLKERVMDKMIATAMTLDFGIWITALIAYQVITFTLIMLGSGI